jgi:Phasin protein
MEWSKMLGADKNDLVNADKKMSVEKSGQRKAQQQGRKAEPRSRKSGKEKGTKSGQLPETSEQMNVQVGPAESFTTEVLLTNTAPIGPAQTSVASFRTVVNAYGDYANKSFEQTASFFEKLAGVRSLAKAVELQTQFARQVFETFVADSQRIRELHRELAKQRLGQLEGFLAKTTESALPRATSSR